MTSDMHTLSVLVQNRPGVLTRCAGLFARRGFNIESLAVGPTEDPSRSRITIRVDCSQHSVDQVERSSSTSSWTCSTCRAGRDGRGARAAHDQGHPGAQRRPKIISLAEVFESRVVDVGPEAVSFACVGPPDRLHALEELLRPYGIRELVRTGRIALDRDGELVKRRRIRVVA